jgi:preprotein translocase subunit SecE
MNAGGADAGGRKAQLEREGLSVIERVREFAKDVRVEITRVSWPTREELRDSTIVVIATVILVAAFVGVVDRVLNLGVGLLFR